MIPNNLDGLLVSNFYNILYLTGFKGLSPGEREAFVVLTKKNIYLMTDGRHDLKNFQFPISKLQPNFQFQIRELTPENTLIKHLAEIIEDEKIKKMGFESEDLSFAEYGRVEKGLRKIKLIPTERIIENKRETKQKDEIEKITKACNLTDECLKDIVKIIKPGKTEKEIAFKIENWIKQKGYDLAFYPIVAVDKNSAVPHYDTKGGDGVVRKGSIVLIDFGIRYKDYNSDITRMFFVGKPKTEMRNVYQKLLDVQERVIRHSGEPRRWRDKLRDSRIWTSQIDKYCRKLLTDYGLPNMPHSTGHGIGLEVHEYPRISLKSKEKLKENHVFTIEPGVYLYGKFGMRIEDTVVVDKSGKINTLTKYPKTLW